MLYFFQQLLNGLHSGALYALLAFGYVITNAVLHRTNLAYGAVFAFCGHLMILCTIFAWDVLWLAWPAAIAIGSGIALLYGWYGGLVLSRHVLEPLRRGSPNTIVAATLGVAIMLMELSRIAAGTRDFWLPPILARPIVFATDGKFIVTLTANQLAGCAGVFLLIAGVATMLARSEFGRRWRAVSDDPLAAALCGVDPVRIFRTSVALGASLAAVAGILAAMHYGNISVGTGLVYGLKILFVTAAGSYSSPVKAALGAMLFGIGESLWAGYFPMEWRDAWMLAFLAALLVLRAPDVSEGQPDQVLRASHHKVS